MYTRRPDSHHSPPRWPRPTDWTPSRFVAQLVPQPLDGLIPTKYRQYTVLHSVRLPTVQPHT